MKSAKCLRDVESNFVIRKIRMWHETETYSYFFFFFFFFFSLRENGINLFFREVRIDL